MSSAAFEYSHAMHFWDGFYNRNVPFVIIMDMSGHRITTKHPTFPRAGVSYSLFLGVEWSGGMIPPRWVIRILNQIIQFVPH